MGVRDPRYKETGEYPQRKVMVKRFLMDKYPVTNAQFWYVKFIGKIFSVIFFTSKRPIHARSLAPEA